jgi:hypothetical protein
VTSGRNVTLVPVAGDNLIADDLIVRDDGAQLALARCLGAAHFGSTVTI